MIFFIATVYRHMVFGPQNVQSEVWSKFCRDDPWTNLLYINNFNLKDVTTEVQIFENEFLSLNCLTILVHGSNLVFGYRYAILSYYSSIDFPYLEMEENWTYTFWY